MNTVILLGRLGKDPEISYTQSSTAIANLSIATTEKRKKGNEWEDVTEWHKVIFFGSQADAIGKYLSKGNRILITGRLQTNDWTDKEGKKHYQTEIIGNSFEFIDSKNDGKKTEKTEPKPQEQGGQDLPF